MSTTSLERRVRRRSIHRSRSAAVSVALIITAVVAAWVGTECVLRAAGSAPLLADPQRVVDAALRPDGAFTTIAEVTAAVLVIAGIVVIVLALTPGRRPRSAVPHERGAVVIDTAILASTAANAAALAAGLPEDHARASARGRSSEVRLVPLSGVPVDQSAVRSAVEDRLGRLDARFGKHVTIRVEQKGTLA
jgi:hypothetical protein